MKNEIKNKKGYFGKYGGQYVPEQLKLILDNLDIEFNKAIQDEKFKKDYLDLMKNFVGRPSPLYLAKNLSNRNKIYFKREDLNHMGAHKINNTIGQALLAKRMNKKKVIAETGAGQHGVATATAAALMGMECEIFMGEVDAKKQKMNVFRMEILGAKVNVVKEGQRTLKEAVDAALGYYINNPYCFYLLGSVVGPHPNPTMVREFQKIIGEETKKQIIEKENTMPDYLIACVGGGSNAIGLFYEFMNNPDIIKIGVEPAGLGLDTGKHAAAIMKGSPGVLHGFYSYLLQDEQGNPKPVYSIASGLDYPGVGPEHSNYHDLGTAKYVAITDKEALDAFKICCRKQGIIPALESSHAIAYALKLDKEVKDKIIIVNLSGRGDKDVEFVSNIN